MNTNKHQSTEKVVGSILEHTTQNNLYLLKTELLIALKNARSCYSCLSWLKNICVSLCPSVVPTLSVSSVNSVFKTGGIF